MMISPLASLRRRIKRMILEHRLHDSFMPVSDHVDYRVDSKHLAIVRLGFDLPLLRVGMYREIALDEHSPVVDRVPRPSMCVEERTMNISIATLKTSIALNTPEHRFNLGNTALANGSNQSIHMSLERIRNARLSSREIHFGRHRQ